MKVLVTGGSGFLGKRLKLYKPDWIYISSKNYDLISSIETKQMFRDIKPDAVIHLAARVGGIKDNAENQALFYYQNVMMNTNVIHEAYLAGVPRVLSSLSTCAFPDKLDHYPFFEKDFHKGSPTETNLSYGYSKRMLHVQSVAYRKQYGMNYSTFCPSNLYGPEDHFGNECSHFVASLIHKFTNICNNKTIVLWSTGSPLRQQLYVDDLCEIIPMLLEKHNSDIPLIVAPNENLSIREMSQIMADIHNDKTVFFRFNGKLDGQYRKDGDNSMFLNLVGGYNFTSFREGIEKTYEWYVESLKEQ
jgi:GDP-L-fucose synthase|tara:strand:- start:1191 stop:2099 length:909 start_codon:yes stop_codon:yes gene_type:complete